MNAPLFASRRSCNFGTNRCAKVEFRCFVDVHPAFESEMPSYATVPKEIANGAHPPHVTVFMAYPEWKTSGAV
ncbi:MAG: hypothetical protein ACP5N9_01470 [Candidatus Bilamarchaeum sp.]